MGLSRSHWLPLLPRAALLLLVVAQASNGLVSKQQIHGLQCPPAPTLAATGNWASYGVH
jgi:hypothetical protein